MNNKKKCFVIMPVSGTKSCTEEEWTGIFEHMIKPAVTGSRLGFKCERAKPLTGAFIRDILESINRADVVIADLTDRNPNVCYELGIRHTLKKRTILITQNINDVPSDLQPYWVVTYKKDLSGAEQFKKRVREILREMQKDPDKPDSPVADFLEVRNIYLSSYEKSSNLKKLTALISELSYNIDSSHAITKVLAKHESEGKGDTTFGVTLARFSNTCLELLLSTSYVKLSELLLKYAKVLNETIRIINKHLDLWHEEGFRETIEERLKQHVPKLEEDLTFLLKKIGKIRVDYANDNYQEPEEPIIVLARPEHEAYLKLKE